MPEPQEHMDNIPMRVFKKGIEQNDPKIQELCRQASQRTQLTTNTFPNHHLFVNAEDVRQQLKPAEYSLYPPEQVVAALHALGISNVTRVDLWELLAAIDNSAQSDTKVSIRLEDVLAQGVSHLAYSGSEGRIIQDATKFGDEVSAYRYQGNLTCWNNRGEISIRLGNGELAFFHSSKTSTTEAPAKNNLSKNDKGKL